MIADLITPEWLREHATDSAWVEVAPDMARSLADEIQLSRAIARCAARSDIECNAKWVCDGPEVIANVWYDVTPSALDDIDRDGVAEAVRYLDMHGQIQRHASNENWVRVMEAA
ncbi:hypothetical protein [Cupriavidus basilensis]|uniref:hypothetical protein n=1 Tax=Cupriavidus basilensis TaxID=68895 RepID=UPI0020A64BB0|nr:hypothetical protein [Cupriavidus basilensis]MCP3018010.1 hypothetical protein [Cupriavidus basilensis]